MPHPVYPDAAQHVVWDIAGNCTAPWLLQQVGVGHFQADKDWTEAAWQPNRTLCQKVRCRKCAACLRQRARQWRERAIAEWRRAWHAGLRTWFVTLTHHPEERYRLKLETEKRVGPGFHRLGPEDQARELFRTAGKLPTRWLKRLRKAGAKFRYLLVTEPHKDGFPHFHLLIHEVDDLNKLTKRLLQSQWARHGFSQAKLVENAGACSYVAKYLAKSTMNKVRPSRGYGRPDELTPGLSRVARTALAPGGRYPHLLTSTVVDQALRARECEHRSAVPSGGRDPEGIEVVNVENVLEHNLLEGVDLSPPNEQSTLAPLNQSREVLGLPPEQGARPTRPEHGGSLTAFMEAPPHSRGPLSMRDVTDCDGEATGPPAR